MDTISNAYIQSEISAYSSIVWVDILFIPKLDLWIIRQKAVFEC